MIFVLIAMSVFFFALAFIPTEKNAGNIFPWYKILSEKEREKTELPAYIRFFRIFHLILSLTFLIAGFLFLKLLKENVAGIFLAVWPILAYMYFLSASGKFVPESGRKWNKLGIIILSLCLVLISIIFTIGMRESNLTVSSSEIIIAGSYGEKIDEKDIASLQFVDSLPDIKNRINGFALGKIRKGWFKTSEGEKVKLLLNADRQAIVMIRKTTGEKIYLSVDKSDNPDLLRAMEEKQGN